MPLPAFQEAQKIWRKISKESSVPALELELEVHRKLLNIFQVGDFYYYIFNCLEAKVEHVHDTVTSVLGYAPEDFTVPKIMECIHPDDLPWFLTFENETTEFFTKLPPGKCMKYKVRYDYRIRKADGEYLRILQQVVTIQSDAEGTVLRTLGVHTDISHLKKEGKPVLSFIGLEGEPSYIDVKAKNIYIPEKEVLSMREKEILALLIAGNHSHEISDQLCISTHTVNTHRRNILAKTGANSTSELVAKAIREGWL